MRFRSIVALATVLLAVAPPAISVADDELPGVDLGYGADGGLALVELARPAIDVERIAVVAASAYQLGSVDGFMAIGAMSGRGVAAELSRPVMQQIPGVASDTIRTVYQAWLVAGNRPDGAAVVQSASGLTGTWGDNGVLALPVDALHGSVRFVDDFRVGGVSADGATIWVAAFTSGGSLDTSFGSGGVATVDLGPGADELVAFAWPFVIGVADGGTRIAKLSSNGSPATSFPVDGIASPPFSDGVVIQSAQVQGSALYLGGTADGMAYVARLTTGGGQLSEFDLAFSGGVVGFGPSTLGSTRAEIVVADDTHVRLATVRSDGTIDPAVPVVTAPVVGAIGGRSSGAWAIVTQADGAVIIDGRVNDPPQLARFDTGWEQPEIPLATALDTSPDGSAVVGGNGLFGAWLFSLDPDGARGGPLGQGVLRPPSVGAIISLGVHSSGSFTVVSHQGSATHLTRFLPNGDIDRGYGTFGRVQLPDSAANGTVLFAADGSITIVTSRAFRISASGQIDAGFGVVSAQFGGNLLLDGRLPFFVRVLQDGRLQVFREGGGHIDSMVLTTLGDIDPNRRRSLFGGYGPLLAPPVAAPLVGGSVAIALAVRADPGPSVLRTDGETVDLDKPLQLSWPCAPSAVIGTTDAGLLVNCTDADGGLTTKLRSDFSTDRGFGFDGELGDARVHQFAALGGDVFLQAGTQGSVDGARVAVARLLGNEPSAPQPARYVPLATPLRLVDTRGGAPVNASSVREFNAAGSGGIPATATALAANVAVVGPPASGGFGQLFGVGTTSPGYTSTINLRAGGGTISSFTTVRIGPSGKVGVYLSVTAHVIVDIYGYWLPATSSASGRYVAEPFTRRLLDTRTTAGGKRRLNANEVRTVATQRPGATAAIVNITSVQPTAAGWITAYGATLPSTSTLNFTGGETRANLAIVPLSADGTLRIKPSTSTHVLVDIVGYITGPTAAVAASGLFVAESPTRVIDTRTNDVPDPTPTPGTSTQYWISGTAGVPASAVAVFATLISVRAPQAGWLDFEVSIAAPHNNTSVLNVLAPSTVVSNSAVAVLGNGGLAVYTTAGGDVVVDVWGWFTGP
jgi:hypothetical protein